MNYRKYINNTSGIPELIPTISFKVESALTDEIFFSGDRKYYSSAGEFVCIDENYQKIFTFDVSDHGCDYGEGLVANDRYIFCCWGVFEKFTGDFVFSLSDEIDLKEKRRRRGISENYYINYLGFMKYSKFKDQIYCINSDTLEVSEFFLKGKWRFLSNDYSSDKVLAISSTEEKMGLLDLAEEVFLWEKNLNDTITYPSCVDDEYAYVVNEKWKGIYKISLETGEEIELVSEELLDSQLNRIDERYPIYYLSLTDDAIYMMQSKRLVGFSKHNGDLLFESDEFDGGFKSSVVTQGDMLFAINDELLIAFDRYTGEKIWQAEEEMIAAYHVMASGNCIYFSNTLGEVRCYEWTQEYHSPYRITA